MWLDMLKTALSFSFLRVNFYNKTFVRDSQLNFIQLQLLKCLNS